MTWTIEVINTGSAGVTVTQIFDTFESPPTAPQFNIASCGSPQGGICTRNLPREEVTWTGAVSLAPGQTMQLQISGVFLSQPPPGSDARCNIRWEVTVQEIGTIPSETPALCVEVLP